MSNSSFDFLVFGATGMQGGIVVRDLVEAGYRVVISGRDSTDLLRVKEKNPAVVGMRIVDLNDRDSVIGLVVELRPPVVVNCAEGDWNRTVYDAALAGGCHVIDLGSDIPTTKAQLALDAEFKLRNLTAVTGCGSTPGINNVMLSHALRALDRVETVEAGFAWNSNLKTFVVPFSMESILEEFTQPAPIVERGIWKEKTPMTTVEDKSFRAVGSQKNFLVRHPETGTFFEYYKAKGLENVRFFAGFPAHSFDKIMTYVNDEKLKDGGMVYVEGYGNVPLIGLTKVLKEIHRPPPDYVETENLWVNIHGTKNDSPVNIVMECIVPTLADWKDAGCNIDTGFPASIIAQMILKGDIQQAGSFAPEVCVPHEAFFEKLESRGMSILMNGKKLDINNG